MNHDEKIKQLEREIKTLKILKEEEQRQKEINATNKMKIVCSCGAEQSIDEYNDSSSTIRISGDMSCNIAISCKKCGKRWFYNSWC